MLSVSQEYALVLERMDVNMADKELVIKIPEELISEIDDENYQSVISWYDTTLYYAIKNGTPLRKGHDKLIDVKDLLEEICLEDTKENRKLNLGEIITLEDIDRIEPVIEADEET